MGKRPLELNSNDIIAESLVHYTLKEKRVPNVMWALYNDELYEWLYQRILASDKKSIVMSYILKMALFDRSRRFFSILDACTHDEFQAMFEFDDGFCMGVVDRHSFMTPGTKKHIVKSKHWTPEFQRKSCYYYVVTKKFGITRYKKKRSSVYDFFI